MGALQRLRVIGLASIGPGPMCALRLADLGADEIDALHAGGAALRA